MTRFQANTSVSRRWALLGVGVVCLAFALKALLLIDATSLWSDELYSVGKSFQPDFAALLALLRQDTHPPLYYSLLWLWGGAVGSNPAQPAPALMVGLWVGGRGDGGPGCCSGPKGSAR